MTSLIIEAAITVGDSLALSLVVKATAVMAVALLVARLVHRSRASVRHMLFTSLFGVLLMLPVATTLAPGVLVRLPIAQPGATPGLPGVTASVAAVEASEASVNGPFRPISDGREWPSIAVSTLLLTLWSAGAMVCFVPLVAGMWQIRRIRQSGLPWRQALPIVSDIAAEVGVRRRIEVLLHEGVAGPMTCGAVLPAIVFPVDARTWNGDDLRRAITHELEHVRRADWLILCIARSVCALYWFHPLVWISWRQLRLEAERACDDAVIRRAEPAVYADQLVTLAQRVAATESRPLLAMANRGDLSARVRAVLDAEQRRGRAGALPCVAAVIAAIVLVGVTAPLRAVAVAQASAPAVVEQRAPTVQPVFEVASIKPVEARVNGFSISNDVPGQFSARNVPLRVLILWVYGVREHQLINPSGWGESRGFDITARYPPHVPKTDVAAMVEALLAERFNLKVHREVREGPVYALVPSRGDRALGPKLRRTDVDCFAVEQEREKERQTRPRLGLADSVPPCMTVQRDRIRFQELIANGRTMAQFARLLSSLAGRDVIDRTELTGTFDIELTWTREDSLVSPSAASAAANDAPVLFTALREQLNLRLESSRGPVSVLVIDEVTPPTPD